MIRCRTRSRGKFKFRSVLYTFIGQRTVKHACYKRIEGRLIIICRQGWVCDIRGVLL